MLKFILILVVLFLALRLVLRVLGIRVFFSRGLSSRGSFRKDTPSASGKKVEEADYEVLDSRLSGSNRDDG
ncbi:MAG: hypothetical protein HGA70_03205 [Chlorobiaceae bacterium]|nr:hypothetical protein [Chlorobiaceae bacterium]NTW11387.1 hypothetical protein [Chlorobiaceae bacterium]